MAPAPAPAPPPNSAEGVPVELPAENKLGVAVEGVVAGLEP